MRSGGSVFRFASRFSRYLLSQLKVCRFSLCYSFLLSYSQEHRIACTKLEQSLRKILFKFFSVSRRVNNVLCYKNIYVEYKTAITFTGIAIRVHSLVNVHASCYCTFVGLPPYSTLCQATLHAILLTFFPPRTIFLERRST